MGGSGAACAPSAAARRVWERRGSPIVSSRGRAGEVRAAATGVRRNEDGRAKARRGRAARAATTRSRAGGAPTEADSVLSGATPWGRRVSSTRAGVSSAPRTREARLVGALSRASAGRCAWSVTAVLAARSERWTRRGAARWSVGRRTSVIGARGVCAASGWARRGRGASGGASGGAGRARLWETARSSAARRGVGGVERSRLRAICSSTRSINARSRPSCLGEDTFTSSTLAGVRRARGAGRRAPSASCDVGRRPKAPRQAPWGSMTRADPSVGCGVAKRRGPRVIIEGTRGASASPDLVVGDPSARATRH